MRFASATARGVVTCVLAISCGTANARASDGAAASAAPSQATPIATATFWCSRPLTSDGDTSGASPSALIAFRKARHDLCSGDFAQADAELTEIEPAMHRRMGDGTHWSDFVRTFVYALIAAHDPDRGRRFLDAAEDASGGWKPGPADRAFANGNYSGAFAKNVDDNTSLLHETDPHMTYAIADLRAKKTAAAIDEQLAVAHRTSITDSILGDCYAQQGRWGLAYDAWLRASIDAPASPHPPSLDHWNFSALEMLYAYRAHAPAAAPATPVTCGSPTDIATVEAIALASTPGLTKANVIEASIVDGIQARVIIETKGSKSIYLIGDRAGHWQVPTMIPPDSIFPSSCKNPDFVNVPSGM